MPVNKPSCGNGGGLRVPLIHFGHQRCVQTRHNINVLSSFATCRAQSHKNAHKKRFSMPFAGVWTSCTTFIVGAGPAANESSLGNYLVQRPCASCLDASRSRSN